MEAQRLSSIWLIISVSFSQILPLICLGFPSVSSFSVFMVVRYHFELAFIFRNSVIPKYDSISNILKTLWMLGKS